MAKRKAIKSAPQFDEYLEQAKSQPIVVGDDIKKRLLHIYEKMSGVAVSGGDEYRNIWINIQRGDIEDFREYMGEGAEKDRADLEDLWLCDYPEELKWYDFAVSEYNGQYYFHINSELTFHITEERPEYFEKINVKPLISFLEKEIARCVDWLLTDEAGYNHYINENLSYRRRTGKILRKKYWEFSSEDKQRITKGLHEKDVEILKKVVKQSGKDAKKHYLPEMTAGKYLDFCKMGYEANNYFKGRELTSLEMYNAFADGRHEGLTELDPDSAEAFRKWFHDPSRRGGHPFEVCRGGTSTHISLYVDRKVNEGWFMWLGGSSTMRVNETVKFAIALYNNQAPFVLHNAEEIYNMICGTDYIGIVPDEFSPSYCHSLFDHDDERIIDFMNLDWEENDKIIAAAEWYPVVIKEIL
jgi:hypothetical protein